MIPEFFENREVFITGGSGSVGKALIEKLLRSCNIRRIYVLLRAKRNYTIEQRLERLCNDKIFRTLKAAKPDEIKKIIAIPGDVVLPNIGITPEYAKLMENVAIIFHCAATVRFDEPLRMSMILNVGGTYETLKFAETLKNLILFMHVSTFFSNPYLKYVEPKVYPSPVKWQTIMKYVKNESNDELLDGITRKFITGFPNTYTFTKNLAESVVDEWRSRLPVAIFRPSIVVFSISDPEPGFPPALMGAMGLFALMLAGILKTLCVDKTVYLDWTPMDICVKSTLYYSVKGAEVYKSKEVTATPVYVFSSRKDFPITLVKSVDLIEGGKHWENNIMVKSFMIPGCYFTESEFVYHLLVFVKQLLPAMLVDTLLVLCGRKPALMGIYRKVYQTLAVMKPFICNNFDNPGPTIYEQFNKDAANSEFSVEEDLRNAWKPERFYKLAENMSYKMRDVLFNEGPETFPLARRILKVKYAFYYLFQAILAYFVLRWMYRTMCSYAF